MKSMLVLILAVTVCGFILAVSATSSFARCWTVSGFTFCDDRESFSGHHGGGRRAEPDDKYDEELARAAEQQRARLAEEAMRRQKAEDADRSGMDAAGRGDWTAAANYFIQALRFAPDSTGIRAHLDQANTALADLGAASEITALRHKVDDAIAKARIESMRLRLEDAVTAQRLKAMQAKFNADNNPLSVSRHINSGKLVSYPALRHPVQSNSPPGRVLDESQGRIKAIDEKIRRAQIALRRLIKSNLQSEDQRVEWVKVSEEATIEAQSLSVNLAIDLVGAHVDHLTEINDQERLDVLNRLISGAEGGNRRSGIHTAFGVLLDRKDELKRCKEAVRLAEHTNDIRVKIEELSQNRETQYTPENLWEIANLFEKVKGFAGPSKDLLDSTYTIYKQAKAFETLSTIRGNQEKTLQTAAVLRSYIIKLEKEKKTSRKKPSENSQK